MVVESPDRPLSRITTLWTLVCEAHGESAEAAAAARQALLQRYGKAVHRYLLGALRDPDAADELSQEFALRFLRGGLGGANPQRGHFRNYVKGTLFHLIADYHRRKQRDPQRLPANGPEPAAPARPPDDPDRSFLESWRDQLLHDAWEVLALYQRETGKPFHDVLRYRAEHREVRSAQMAEQLSRQFGRAVSAAWVRQTLHRARDKFADLLLREVEATLQNPSAEAVEQELIDLDLLTYCKPALDRYRRGGSGPASPP
jgi:RNA polymerase sigma-70 factor (ECF subfamily)